MSMTVRSQESIDMPRIAKPAKELDSVSFMKEVNHLLKTAQNDGWSDKYLTDQILHLTQGSPKMVKMMDFPRTPYSIRNQIIIPMRTPQKVEHVQFSISEKIFTRYNNQGVVVSTWEAQSGHPRGRVSPDNKGPLPPGEYHLEGTTRPKGDKAFCDQMDNCWSQTLIDHFGSTRDYISAHPDGDPVGTSGCIGFTDADTREIKKYLSKASGVPVIVKP